mmetsp:Transcript_2256/g.8702  ORF Transcript_2256/g.8702 Transcript_2256/m.8702 type:complete len:213 (-) Transcript_2256:1237-1875(-)
MVLLTFWMAGPGLRALFTHKRTSIQPVAPWSSPEAAAEAAAAAAAEEEEEEEDEVPEAAGAPAGSCAAAYRAASRVTRESMADGRGGLASAGSMGRRPSHCPSSMIPATGAHALPTVCVLERIHPLTRDWTSSCTSALAALRISLSAADPALTGLVGSACSVAAFPTEMGLAGVSCWCQSIAKSSLSSVSVTSESGATATRTWLGGGATGPG